MTFISVLNPVVLLLLGFATGALLLFLLNRKDVSKAKELTTQIAVSEEKLKLLRGKEAQCQTLQNELTQAKSENARLQGQMQEQSKSTAEKLQLLQNAEIQLKTQFENLANQIFEHKTGQLNDRNKNSLNDIVKPLKDQIGEFKKRVETVYEHETRDRILLREEIVQLRRDTEKINQEAINLTHALKGDKKVQGNWGEMILEKVLEQSGLRKGTEYETQRAFRDNDKNLFKPDVIIHLPENKDVIIDSKVSLLAYERYCSSEGDQQRIEALKQHTEAIRKHIIDLSDKDYSGLKGLRSLDFVLLFMPIEAAFMAAFQADEKLFSDAFEHKIIVVTPTTLLATLRTIENIWRYERQNENAKIIADKAGALYDKIRGFVDDLEKLGTQLNTVNKTYDGVMNKLIQGNGNLIRQAENFVELGVKVKKPLSKSIVVQAGLEDIDNQKPNN